MGHMLTVISSDACNEPDTEGLCMKKNCEIDWEIGRREEAEGSFQINLFNASNVSIET